MFKWFFCKFLPARRLEYVFLLLGLCLLVMPPAQAQTAPTAKPVLVVYDSSGQWGWIGDLYAKEMQNALGHFNVPIVRKPVETYVAGDMNNYQAVFYLGLVYDNALPSAFLSDVWLTDIPVCWMYSNIWKLAWTPSYYYNFDFEAKYGFRFEGFQSPSFIDFEYKDTQLVKDQTDRTFGKISILDSNLASVRAVCHTAETGAQELPYIVQAGNFWYVADNPFGYVGFEDRYLAFADLLHDILGIDHQEQHHAFIRIEDVHANVEMENVKAIADYLYPKGLPFGMTVIPRYVDPFGAYNNGKAQTVNITATNTFGKTVKYAAVRGGSVILHGYTHQYGNKLNPFTGVSGDDTEFYRIILDANGKQVLVGAVPEDTPTWVQGRLTSGINLLKKAGFTAVAWETPHYIAAEADYPVFAKNFKLATDRGLYFATDPATNTTYCLNQLAPYLQKDIYGIVRVPETMGYVDLEGEGGWPGKPSDLIARAKAQLVVRDGWAGFYFHPYLDVNLFKEVVEGVDALGYEFTPINASLANGL